MGFIFIFELFAYSLDLSILESLKKWGWAIPKIMMRGWLFGCDVGYLWYMAKPTLIFLTVLGLLIFGVIMVGNASFADAASDFGNKWYYLRLQAIWSVIGLVAMFLLAK